MPNILEIFSFLGMQYADEVGFDIFDHFVLKKIKIKSEDDIKI